MTATPVSKPLVARLMGVFALLAMLMLAPPAAAQSYIYSFDQRLPSNYDEVFNLPSIGVISLRWAKELRPSS